MAGVRICSLMHNHCNQFVDPVTIDIAPLREYCVDRVVELAQVNRLIQLWKPIILTLYENCIRL